MMAKKTFGIILFLLLGLTPVYGENITLYFYSSETNINNYKSLKMEFDRFLSRYGPYTFQPFSERRAFEEQIRGKKECLVILSSWHFRNIDQNKELTPMLVGVRNGRTYQKRVLVAAQENADIDAIRSGSISSASNVEHTRSVIKEMFPGKGLADAVRILTVPKDVDALMSVGFQVSRAALISENALDALKLMDPMLYKQMEIIAEGQPSPLMIVAAPEKFSTALEVAEVLQKMPSDADGMNVIKMLDLDDWKTVSDSKNLKAEGVR